MPKVASTNNNSLVGFYTPSRLTKARKFFESTVDKTIRKHPNATLAGVYLLCGVTFVTINGLKTAALTSGAASPVLIASAACGIVGSVSLVAAGINHFQMSRVIKKIKKIEELKSAKLKIMELKKEIKAIEESDEPKELKELEKKKIKLNEIKDAAKDSADKLGKLYKLTPQEIEDGDKLNEKLEKLKTQKEKYVWRGKKLSFAISVPFAIGTILFCTAVPEFTVVPVLSFITSLCFMTGATSKSAKDIDQTLPLVTKKAIENETSPLQSVFSWKPFANNKHHLFTVAGAAISLSSLIGLSAANKTAETMVSSSGTGNVAEVSKNLSLSSGIGIFGGVAVVGLAVVLHFAKPAESAKNTVLKAIGEIAALKDNDELENLVQFNTKKGRFKAKDTSNKDSVKLASKLNKVLRSVYLYGDEPPFEGISEGIDNNSDAAVEPSQEDQAFGAINQILGANFNEIEKEAIEKAKNDYNPHSSWRNRITPSCLKNKEPQPVGLGA